ncbi:unnamed protein product [Bursaphelenchus okinawaensis]|uniref:Uncharacterized protein n=1 Tax=Bursaphelenchus okinawaensis TaxID=465554 RepID=A0A811L0R9_9BILA|nr:unnamed protein product [Bursaphelenchus okinawaensis]CAG9116586.1 unnamed protein product [Bursaphelenchus okinawaensis]
MVLVVLLAWICSVGLADEFHAVEKCYSCSSANFASRWPRENNSYLYITEQPIMAVESCDNMKAALPVVPCPNSVCVKFVLLESSATRAVCSALNAPVIVRDCWSRVLHSNDPALKLLPMQEKPVRLIGGLADPDKTIGAVYACNGFLCNLSSLHNPLISLISIILFLICKLN